MKSLTRILPVMVAALMIISLPALAVEGSMGQKAETGAGARKNECLIVAKNCGIDSINARVNMIEREISKGSAVYTHEELNTLERELKDATRMQKIYNNEFPPVAL
ncbi:MAG: hypothetical protein M0T70_04965 [Geobacteraceae bacterium]|nr:hypothetical protein [Geobacteraceae bacterium]